MSAQTPGKGIPIKIEVMSHEAALRRIRERGVQISTIIDVGAARGSWSMTARKVFPNAQCHLIEAKSIWKDALEAVVNEQSGFSYTLAMAGAHDGKGNFKDTGDPYGGGAVQEASDATMALPMVSIDMEIERHHLKAPFLIKIDTHGFEREIMRGASNALGDTQIIVAEVYNFSSQDRRFPELTQFYESLGFHCIDMAEPMFRSYDHALWQFDLLFVRSTQPEVKYRGFGEIIRNTSDLPVRGN